MGDEGWREGELCLRETGSDLKLKPPEEGAVASLWPLISFVDLAPGRRLVAWAGC